MQDLLKQANLLENDYVKEFKKNGNKVIGYGCVTTPVEILDAANVLPYRIRALGNSNTEIADAHLSRFNCSFCRCCLQLGLDGTFDFLDGLIENNGCDHLRGMFENWQYTKPVDFFYYLKVPHILTEDSRKYFVEELKGFTKTVGDEFGVEITDDILWDAIKTRRRIRDKLAALYELREKANPGLSGVEAFSIALVGSAMLPKDFEDALDKILAQRKDHEIKNVRARLLLGGSATDEIDFLKDIESLGAVVVSDALCYGSRNFWPEKEADTTSPYHYLSQTYLDNILCPRMFDDYHSRINFLFETIEKAKIDGVILVHNKFCDVHGCDNVPLRMDLEKKGVPVLQLEKEYGALADLGRMKTRVQAFLERIGG